MRENAGLAPSEEVFIQDTPLGPLTIRPHCPPGFFTDLILDPGIGTFAHYSSIIQKLDVFEKIVNGKNGRVALALIDGMVIVGYLACWHPHEDERWSKLGDLMYELGAIEVSRNFRKNGVARTLIGSLMQESFFENRVAYMNGYSWHWDLDGNHLTMGRYRRLLMDLMKGFGFKEYSTNEANISLRAENVFMARIGPLVSDEDQKRFRDLRFGIRMNDF